MSKEELVGVDNSFLFLSEMMTHRDALDVGSFDDFVQNVFSKGFPNYNFNVWHIRKVSKFLDDVLKTESKKAVAAMPRYHLKSTLFGMAFSEYQFIKGFGDGYYFSFSESLANYHISLMKLGIQANPILSKKFEDMNPRSDVTINYKIGNKRVRMYGSGILSAKRGWHSDSICVFSDTIVLTGSGYKNISEIKLGESVRTHENRYRKVTKLYERSVSEEIRMLFLDNGEVIGITKNHEFLTKRGWVASEYLTVEDILMKVDVVKYSTKGKTYEELYGAEKAEKLRKLRFANNRCESHPSEKLGLTYESLYGNDKADNIRDKIARSLTGKYRNREIRSCACGKEFEVTKSIKNKYCSINCYWKYSKCGNNFRAKIGNFKLENNPNWQNGKSFEPYPIQFNSDLKEVIRNRDSKKCVLCGSTNVLQIHHIDYDKDNLDEKNLITLCKRCHAKTNSGTENREKWKRILEVKILECYANIHNGTHILQIEDVFYNGLVYNIEVEEDHSYCGKGVIFHNCSVDDILGTVENPMNLNELTKVERVFLEEVSQIPNLGCPMIVYGTVMDFSDLLFKLKENPQYSSLWLPAIQPDPEHEVLWPEVFSKKVLDARKDEIGWKAFSTEFLLTPVLSMESLLPKEQLDPCIIKSLTNFRVPGY